MCTKQWAELECGPGARLALKGVEGEAFVTTGYTPFLSFQVRGARRSNSSRLLHVLVITGVRRYQRAGSRRWLWGGASGGLRHSALSTNASSLLICR